MKKAIVCLVACVCALAACASQPATSDTSQALCTIEDQDSGTCTLPQLTSAHIQHLIEQYGEPATRDRPPCTNTSSGNVCLATLHYGGFHVNVLCVQWSDEFGDGHQSCSTTVCWETETGLSRQG